MKGTNIFSLACIVALAFFFTACGPSPESAAEEICDCLKNSPQNEIMECQELAKKYEEKFKGEDREVFSRELASCTMGSLMGN